MAGYVFVGTDADENLGAGYPWISPTWLLNDNGVWRTPTSGEDLAGDDTIYGLGGDDVISGGAGLDVIYGGDGNDTIYLFEGDKGYGGSGDDEFIAFRSLDSRSVVHGGTGTDTLTLWGAIDITGVVIRGMERLTANIWTPSLTAAQLGAFDTVIALGSYDYGSLQLTGGGNARFAIDPALSTLTIYGSAETEKLTLAPGTTATLVYLGGPGDGTVTAGLADDRLSGGAGRDRLSGGPGDDTLYGNEGNDVLYGGPGDDVLDGGPGTDWVSYAWASASWELVPTGVHIDLRIEGPQDTRADGIDTITNVENVQGSRFDDRLIGTDGPNVLRGGAGNDVLIGGRGRDRLFGGTGDDWLDGGPGNDIIVGGLGKDYITTGAGQDVVLYESLSDSSANAANRDVITDFTPQLDVIDLARIDADSFTPGDQAFRFIGTAEFSGAAGELRYDHLGAGITIVAADVTGDGVVDFEIQLSGRLRLSEANFVL
jgi:Ca2+-binding RTX toxin-like protein